MKPLSGKNPVRPRPAVQRARAGGSIVSKILKAAYRLHFRDKSTRLAVKRCLG